MECKIKIVTSKNRGKWNHLKMIQKIAEQRNGKARHQGNTTNSHIEDCAPTSESINIKDVSLLRETALPVRTIHCNHIAAVILYTLRVWLVCGI